MKLKSHTYLLVPFLLVSIVSGAHKARAQTKDERPTLANKSARIPSQPYEKFSTRDRFKREINFYLSEAGGGQDRLPLVLYIEGSGCGSRFEERNGRILPAGGHIVVADVFKNKARVLVVEKPGVKYLFQPPEGCQELAEFNREHTLERWVEANKAAVAAARRLPQIDKNRTLVVGHSEGGLVACRVARELAGSVTHVATIAGGGPSQLFDLISLARKGEFFDRISSDGEKRVQYVLDNWRKIEADPMSAEKFFFGFAYRRWSTFLSSSPLEELTAVKANIYIAQGTSDKAVDPASADTLYAQLVAKNKPVTYDRVEGANHSFRIEGKPKTDGWEELFVRIRDWFIRA